MNMLFDKRMSGVILHPTSLPGPHGSGDLGPAAYHFVDWLATAGQSLWQMLPVSPIGPGNSPYAGISAFAGNPLLIDLADLVDRGWLNAFSETEFGDFSSQHVDYDKVVAFRMGKLQSAAKRFFSHASALDRSAFESFCECEKTWLDDYALFMVLDEHYANKPWPEWEKAISHREPAALAVVYNQQADAIRAWKFIQWCFSTQWQALKTYANQRGIRIIGDVPIFIAHQSVDCWVRPDLYLLDANNYPTVVAGVPPDYFSPTGQYWGNPLYNWAAMKADSYMWWVERMKRQLVLSDILRIDHFRGFAGYWEIPASASSAQQGHWVPGPGADLFEKLEAALGTLPVIAEDLGVITPDVTALREHFAYPGMRILQFAFAADAQHHFLPHNYVANTVVYTGTHDNDTIRGWWASCSEHERAFARQYLDMSKNEPHWALIRAAVLSVAGLSIYQFQDVLGLDGAHRMNTPGKIGCWEWRFAWDDVQQDAALRLAALCALGGRAKADLLPSMPAYPADMPRP